MLSANDTNSDGNKLYSKIDVFFCSNLPIDDDIINLMFEAPRGRPKDDDDMTYPTRGVIDPKNADVISEQPLNSVLNVKAVVAAFNQEKALVGAFSVIVQLHRWIGLQHYF